MHAAPSPASSPAEKWPNDEKAETRAPGADNEKAPNRRPGLSRIPEPTEHGGNGRPAACPTRQASVGSYRRRGAVGGAPEMRRNLGPADAARWRSEHGNRLAGIAHDVHLIAGIATAAEPYFTGNWPRPTGLPAIAPANLRSFKGIVSDDISEFESYMPSQAVSSICAAKVRAPASSAAAVVALLDYSATTALIAAGPHATSAGCSWSTGSRRYLLDLRESGGHQNPTSVVTFQTRRPN